MSPELAVELCCGNVYKFWKTLVFMRVQVGEVEKSVSELTKLEAGWFLRAEYDSLKGQGFEVQCAVSMSGDINSPTFYTNCLYNFGRAREILMVFPSKGFSRELAKEYLEFEKVRRRGMELLGKEYADDNEHYQAMVQAEPGFEQAAKDARAMLEE